MTWDPKKALERMKQAGDTLAQRARPTPEQLARLKEAVGQGQQALESGSKAVAQKAQEALSTDTGKKVAAGAATGALAGAPIPVLGPVAGAVVGAGVGYWLANRRSEPDAELERRCKSLLPSERAEELRQIEDLYDDGKVTREHYERVRKLLED
jgi:hypothetical protein